MCQLPSYSGMIKTNSNNPYHKEYTFIKCFKLKSFYFDNDYENEYGNIDDNNKKLYEKKRYKKIYFINGDYDEFDNNINLENKKDYEYVLEKMLEDLNYNNENNKQKFDYLY
jgi:hypothetical protein